ncbi:hypothetical protein ABOZ73_07470 [Caulobacter sp. 73W]|uniref:Uncharacterized protein n=1 Tax=Caulobacter sp. 73W TaxID=3161137 RepID=A0AB39KXX3_9CAUL
MLNLTWEMAFPIGVILLGLALAYGLLRYKTRNKANDNITEEATREEYSHPATYDEREGQLRDRLQ